MVRGNQIRRGPLQEIKVGGRKRKRVLEGRKGLVSYALRKRYIKSSWHR